MRFEFNVINPGVGARKAAIKFAEIDIQIFQLGTESADYSRLHART
jgi:hypothetical protein